MASTERSLGWATGVAGTDGAVAYDTTRMIAMERNTLGTGRLLTGSFLTMTLTVGNTILSIADGAAIINGYFYESNGAVTIAAAGLANATYTIAVIANTTVEFATETDPSVKYICAIWLFDANLLIAVLDPAWNRVLNAAPAITTVPNVNIFTAVTAAVMVASCAEVTNAARVVDVRIVSVPAPFAATVKLPAVVFAITAIV